jgi:hypothetical protein
MYGPYPVTEFIGQSEEQFNHICIDIARQRIADRWPTLDVLVPLSPLSPGEIAGLRAAIPGSSRVTKRLEN